MILADGHTAALGRLTGVLHGVPNTVEVFFPFSGTEDGPPRQDNADDIIVKVPATVSPGQHSLQLE